MQKLNLGIYVLTGIALIGLILLLVLDKSTNVIIPILTAFIGLIAGKNQDNIAGAIGSVFKKKQ